MISHLQGGWPRQRANPGSGIVEGLGVLLHFLLRAPAVRIMTAIGVAIGVRLDRWITSVREY
jgi:hypothetical protein